MNVLKAGITEFIRITVVLLTVVILKVALLLSVITLPAIAKDVVYASTYLVPTAPDTLIHGASILTGTGELIQSGYLVLANGVIEKIGAGTPAAMDDYALVIDASGKWLTPGIIDIHSHLGNSASPSYNAHWDTNESTSPVTSEVWVEHSVWPQDPQFPLALAGGITSLQILPGSANLFGGRSIVLKNVSSRSVQGMKFPGAPYGLKMACGENPKRVYGKKSGPKTRMGNFAHYRKTWIDAQEYQRKWASYHHEIMEYRAHKLESNGKKMKVPVEPKRNLQLETLVGVLEGNIRVHNHCYRADEMAQIIDLSKEFGYQVTAFHHAVEAYKIADLLAENNICAAMWADWTRFKLESFDGINENVALVAAAGACAIVHSDSATGIQRLNQEAAKALAAGRRMGLEISEAEAIRWITSNPADALGISKQTGSLESGKMADVVLWNRNPFSVYARAEKVFIDGSLVFDLEKDLKPVTDFELGQRVREI